MGRQGRASRSGVRRRWVCTLRGGGGEYSVIRHIAVAFFLMTWKAPLSGRLSRLALIFPAAPGQNRLVHIITIDTDARTHRHCLAQALAKPTMATLIEKAQQLAKKDFTDLPVMYVQRSSPAARLAS